MEPAAVRIWPGQCLPASPAAENQHISRNVIVTSCRGGVSRVIFWLFPKCVCRTAFRPIKAAIARPKYPADTTQKSSPSSWVEAGEAVELPSALRLREIGERCASPVE